MVLFRQSYHILHDNRLSTKLWWCVHMDITPPCNQVSNTNSLIYPVDRGRDGIWHVILCCIWDDGCPLACNEGLIHGVQCIYHSLTLYSDMQIAMYQSYLLQLCEIILDFTAANIICLQRMCVELEYQVWSLHILMEWSCWRTNLKLPLFKCRPSWKRLGLKLKESWCWKMFTVCKISQHIICCAL